jgi:hypothetical protein
MNADLDIRWQRRAEQFQKQLLQLERGEIAQQRRQLQALAQTRQASGRLSVLLALLALDGVAASSFHTWPRLQDVAGDLNRVSTNVGDLAPQVEAVRRQVTALTSDLGQMGSTMASLREDFSGVRSDLGSLRQIVDTLPDRRGAGRLWRQAQRCPYIAPQRDDHAQPLSGDSTHDALVTKEGVQVPGCALCGPSPARSHRHATEGLPRHSWSGQPRTAQMPCVAPWCRLPWQPETQRGEQPTPARSGPSGVPVSTASGEPRTEADPRLCATSGLAGSHSTPGKSSQTRFTHLHQDKML